MEEISAQSHGVLSPNQLIVQAPKTPIVDRTRSTIQKISDKNNEDQQQHTQTPRRSARKSVRPPKDYYDIIENNSLRSASKKKLEIPVDDNENQEDESQKQNKSKGGRQKNAKRKARKTKTCKVNNAEEVTEQQQKKDQVGEIEQQHKEQSEEDVTEKEYEKKMDQHQQKQEQEIEQLKKKEDKETEQQQKKEQDHEIEHQKKEQAAEIIQKKEQEENEVSKKQDIASQGESISCVKTSPKQKQDKTVKEKRSSVVCLPVLPESITISGDEPKLSTEQEKTSHMEMEDDFDDLGLKPLNKDEEKEEDMPSLIFIDDEMGETQDDEVLNRTFDAESGNAVEQPEIKSPRKLEPVGAIKIVLTDAQDQNTTILNPNNNSILESNKPKAFKFPTPHKANSKPSLMFSVGSTSARKTQLGLYNKELEDLCSIRRRSKSVTDITETRNKTVTIFSPIDVMSTEDIDKRWTCLDVSNVTQRRRRSKSLDSRIPKPKFMALTKSNASGKLKARKKVPNFAAIHQKQFDNMENLEEHIERRKARAKELTASALKKLPRVESVQKKVPATAADRNARPKAVKKIEIPGNTPQKRMVALTPMKVDAIPRQKNEIQIKSRLPLPTVSKAVTSTSVPVVASQPTDQGLHIPLQNKFEARRQRHMDMFKGRTVKEKKIDFIRGVRSNRRFELQMKHRQQLEEKKI